MRYAGPVGSGALLSTVGLGMRAFLQGLYLILISRWLGPEHFGSFAGTVAIAASLAPLAGWGVVYLLIEHVAKDATSLRQMWATVLIQNAIFGLALIALLGPLSQALGSPLKGYSVVLLGLAELVALPVANSAISASLCVGRGALAALSTNFVALGRLLFAAAAFFCGWTGDPETVAFTHFCGSVVAAFAAHVLVMLLADRPGRDDRLSFRDATKRGTHYAAGQLVGTSYLELDKILMLRTVSSAAVGSYILAFRIVSLFSIPIAALFSAALPRIFSTGESAEGAVLQRRLIIVVIAYCLVATLLALLCAPLMPYIFGAAYQEASGYAVLLAMWILPFGLHQFSANILTGRGRQRDRVVAEAIGSLVVVAINLVLLPSLGVLAAVAALVVGETTMAALCWWKLKANPPVQRIN